MVDRAVLATSVNMRFDTGGNPLEVCLPWPAPWVPGIGSVNMRFDTGGNPLEVRLP